MKFHFVLIVSLLIIGALMPGIYAKSASETNIIFIEAEDLTLDGFEDVTKEGAFGKAIISDANTDTFTLSFDISQTGTYAIWMKVYNQSQSDNSFFYSWNESEKIFDLNEACGAEDPTFKQYNTWYWFRVNERGSGTVRHVPVDFELSAGENSIVFTAREAGAYIDSIIITDDLEYDPGDFEGNELMDTCEFCQGNHFLYESYSKIGKTAEQLFEERLAAENAADISTSPITFDFNLLLTALAVISLGITASCIRRRKI